MPELFDPITIGSLTLRNRLMRSATAERMADPITGAPQPRLQALYRTLAEGGVGLIVTGHATILPSGKAHPEMAAMDDDALIPTWRETIRPAQEAGARVMMQINHCGANTDLAVNPDPVAPSGIATNGRSRPRTMTEEELLGIVQAFGQAARRAREAGFDGVQLHGAHGYLISQFLMPGTNHRDDRWGGDPERRRAFLQAVAAEARKQVGEDYPLWIKLGVASVAMMGLTAAEGAEAARACRDWGIDCVEVSMAAGAPEDLVAKGEARFLPLARVVRQAVGPNYPLALVHSLRTRAVMDEVLASGVVQLISMCRPLIARPGLPNKLRTQGAARTTCTSCDRCWPDAPGEGIACKKGTKTPERG